MKPFLPVSILLGALACGAAAAQDDSSSQQTYAVRGSVVNKLTGQAIGRALVTIGCQVQDATFTDSNGQFEFANIPAGQCILTATRPGFAGYAPQFAQQPVVHRVQVGPNMTAQTIALLPTATITGQITLSTSDSADNIQVNLLRKTIQNGRATWAHAQMRRTNSEGMFLFGNLPPGDYRVYTGGAEDPAPGSMLNQTRWGFAPEYYPADESAFIHLRPGQEARADMMLTQEPFYPVTVPVANGSQRGVGVQVYDSAGHRLFSPSRYDQREQAVLLSLPKGRYLLEAESFGMGQMSGSREITVQNAPLGNVPIALIPTNPVPVNIRREFTAQNNGEMNFVSRGSGGLSAGVNLMLHRVSGESGFAGGGLRPAPGSSDNSSFLLENVRPGTYWVQTTAFQGYVASISSGGADLAKTPLVIGPGGTAAPIDVVLRNDTASLKVTLNQMPSGTQSDAPAYLCLIPQFETTWQPPEHSQLTESINTVGNLPPGTYRVLAFDQPQEVEYSNPEAIKAFSSKGQVVSLEPGGSAQVSLDVISTDSQSQ